MLSNHRWRTIRLAALGLAVLCCGLLARAAEKPEDRKADDPPADAAVEKALDDATMATHLVAWARENKNPEALILAARIQLGILAPNATDPDEKDKENIAYLNGLLKEAGDMAPKVEKVQEMVKDAQDEVKNFKTRATKITKTVTYTKVITRREKWTIPHGTVSVSSSYMVKWTTKTSKVVTGTAHKVHGGGTIHHDHPHPVVVVYVMLKK